MYPLFFDALGNMVFSLLVFFASSKLMLASLLPLAIATFVVVRADPRACGRLASMVVLAAALGYFLPVLASRDAGGVLLAMFAVPAFAFIALTLSLGWELMRFTARRRAPHLEPTK